MTWDELEQEFRIASFDAVEDYLWSSASVLRWLKEAEAEACIRGRLLHEHADSMICELGVGIGESHHLLHPSLYEIDHIAFRLDGDTRRYPIRLVSQEWLDGNVRDWRDMTGRPEYAIQGDTAIRLIPSPDATGLVLLEGYRLPSGTGVRPEINAAHHRHLIHWALHRAYSVPDDERLDLSRAQAAERAFSGYFGERPDSDLRRMTREDVEHHNKPWV
ncbi:MAG TPA: hypothetical protein VIZ86_16740 [Pseudomonas sp.]